MMSLFLLFSIKNTFSQGDFWEATSLCEDMINSLAINDNGHIFAGGLNGIFRSTDNGDNWTGTNVSATVLALAINDSGHIFAGSLIVVFRSTDNGDNWTELDLGLQGFLPVIHALVINDAGHITFVPAQLSSFALEQNYPNPFNPETIIRYQLDRTAEVKLEIYNIVGEKVTTLVDKKLSSGAHFVTWHGSDALGRPVASGVYIYRLQTDSFVESKKMLLLR